MTPRVVPVQKILLVLFVLFISMGIGWYGEKAVAKFFESSKTQSF